MKIYFISNKMCKLILTIICIIALNNLMIVSPLAIGDSYVRRTCIFNYHAGEDSIEIRWGDYGDDTATSAAGVYGKDPSAEVTQCFKQNEGNWWYAVTQDARQTANPANYYTTDTRFIDRTYWQINSQTNGDKATILNTAANENFALPLETNQRPAVYASQYDREINNYFLSFLPNFPTMIHRLSYVLSGVTQDAEGDNTNLRCDGTGTAIHVLFPHFKATLKLYGSKESALKAYNAVSGSRADKITSDLWFDHTSNTFYPLLSDVTGTNNYFSKGQLCVETGVADDYISAHVVTWWKGDFKTSFTNGSAGQTKAAAINQCKAASSETKPNLCSTKPALWIS